MKKVLVIEDDPVIAHVYKTRLEKEDYEAEVAADGQIGFYKIYEFKPDAVLLDLMLPKMNGVEVLRKIRAEKDYNRIPIIVFTNAYVSNMVNEAFLAGATLVFNKASVTAGQILDALQDLIVASAPRPALVPQVTPGPDASSAPGFASQLTEPAFPDSSPDSGAASVATEPGALPLDRSSINVAQDNSASEPELLKSFLERAPEVLVTLRKSTQDFAKANDEPKRLSHLLELYCKVHALTGSAGMAGLRNISKMASALEVLLKDLFEKPENINASTMRTVAHSIDFLAELCSNGKEGDLLAQYPSQILVVDDEMLSRRSIAYALEKTGLKSTMVEEAEPGLNLASKRTFDLIFLDVQMPGMDGFELCAKIRLLPANKDTPIVFITNLIDFKSRARSSLSGGTDLIAKPFLFIELSLKALIFVLRSCLLKEKRQGAAPRLAQRAA